MQAPAGSLEAAVPASLPAEASNPQPPHQRKNRSILDLPDNALTAVFLFLAPKQRRGLPLVCRRWRDLCQHPDRGCCLWAHVEVALNESAHRTCDLAAACAWFAARRTCIKALNVEIESPASWVAVHAILGVVGAGLQQLSVYGTYELPDVQEGEAEQASLWMRLVPNLTGLQLQGVGSAQLADTHFPPGLVSLDLEENMLVSVPSTLGTLTALRSLDLDGADFSDPARLAGLAQCPGLLSLSLERCYLVTVPDSITCLTCLTGLVLNENEELEGAGALGGLRTLRLLEMRQCNLEAIPESVASLPELRTLLLGCNHMSARPFIVPGPYLRTLAMLGCSDLFRSRKDKVQMQMFTDALVDAASLEVLRINRNPALKLTTVEVAEFIDSRPAFRQLVFSQSMGGALDLPALRARFPWVSFSAYD